MSVASSPERTNSFPINGTVGGAVMSAPVSMAKPVVKATPVAKYGQTEFDQENAAFRSMYSGREYAYPIFDRYFSWAMYDAADRTVVQCHANRYHTLSLARDGAIMETHLAIMILNGLTQDPQSPLDRAANQRYLEKNVAQIYQKILGLVAKPSEKISDEIRAEERRRVINVSLNYYKKPVMLFAKYLVDTQQAVDTREAVQKLSRNEACGNFVDAIACEMARMHKTGYKSCCIEGNT